MTAVTIREPRNAKPHVEELAGASPNHESELQYLMNTMLALANGLLACTVEKMPSCANSLPQPEELMSNLSV